MGVLCRFTKMACSSVCNDVRRPIHEWVVSNYGRHNYGNDVIPNDCGSVNSSKDDGADAKMADAVTDFYRSLR